MGQSWTRQSNTSNTNQGEIKYKFDSDWTFRQGFLTATYMAGYTPTIIPTIGANGTMSDAYISAINSSNYTKNTSSQTELYGNIKTGEISHKLMFGYEFTQTLNNWANYTSDSWLYYPAYGLPGKTINLYNPQTYSNPNDYGLMYAFGQNRVSKSNAFYFQDQISWGNWRLLAGLRNERVNTSSAIPWAYLGGFSTTDNTASSNYSQTESATTGRAGVLYMLNPATSVYYSISQSFTPNGGYPGVNNTPLPSSRGLQNEIGVKRTVWKGLEATASLFQINKTNVPAALTNTTYTVNGGEQSKGWEASLVGQATSSLRMIANASGINATVTSATRNSNGTAPAGTQLYGVPKFSANIWGVQDLPINIPGKTSFGLGVVYVGDRTATTPNTNGLILPSYTTVDAGLFYKIEKINLALNVKNITNAAVLNSSQNTFVSRSPGTSYLLTAGMNF
jgi:iron complex outermembrane receptor protein